MKMSIHFVGLKWKVIPGRSVQMSKCTPGDARNWDGMDVGYSGWRTNSN